MKTFLKKVSSCPIIDQTGSYICSASKVVSKYLSLLSKNEFSITDTFGFSKLLKSSSNDECYKDVSYGIESLFTSIPVQETDYILYTIYIQYSKSCYLN